MKHVLNGFIMFFAFMGMLMWISIYIQSGIELAYLFYFFEQTVLIFEVMYYFRKGIEADRK
jgi:hypothetical protein